MTGITVVTARVSKADSTISHAKNPAFTYTGHVTTGFSMLQLAENGGFEPPRAFTQHAFQACAIGH
jgi:hypothetical protein